MNHLTRPIGSNITKLEISDHPDVGFQNLDIEYNHPATSSEQETSMRVFKNCPIIKAGEILSDGVFKPSPESVQSFERIDVSERSATLRRLYLGVCQNCEMFTGQGEGCEGFRTEFKKEK